jgi:hypothetical protein
VIPPDGGPPSRARYTIVHVKKDDKWQLGSVRDSAYSSPPSAKPLRDLEWAIGEWTDETAKGEVARASFEWSENQAFLVSSYATTFKDINLGGGVIWIAWDPEAKRIRSWSFDTSGSFGQGSWTREGDAWTIESTSILPNGKKTSATTVIRRVDADTMTWQFKDRIVDGKTLPDAKEITMKRAK